MQLKKAHKYQPTGMFTLLIFFGGILVSNCNDSGPSINAGDFDKMQLQRDQPDKDLKIMGDPSRSNITIVYNSTAAGNGLLLIYAPDGSLLNRKQVDVIKGMNTWTYNFPEKSSGVYWVKIATQDVERTAKVLKTY